MTVSPSSQPPRAAAVLTRPRALGALAIAAACVGALIIAALAIYYGVRFYAASTLGDMEASIAAPAAMPPPSAGETVIRGAVMPDGEFKPIAVVAAPESGAMPERSAPPSASESAPARVSQTPPNAVESPSETAAVAAPSSAPAAESLAETSSSVAQDAPAPAETSPVAKDRTATAPAPDGRALVAAYNSLYPALATHPQYWTSPSTAGADSYAFGAILRPDGFLSVAADRGEPLGTAPDAARVKIPSIGVDSEVANLAILDFGDTRQYETPNKVVGRIPEKANPGELGRAWLFGHLESPIRGEGDVFRRLPEIPDLLRIGDPVYVEIHNEAGDEFLYQITETKVVHQDALAPFVYGEDAQRAMITLVACVPRLVYDHRILVIGELVGVKPAAA